MNRYLLNISYMGTHFLGLQKLTKLYDFVTPDRHTVQGQIEIALRNLKGIQNSPSLVTSSRTDAGVHALHSTGHFDLKTYSGNIFEPTAITAHLNKNFFKNNVQIRVIKTYRVPMSFHCRNAISRTYLYRIAIPNKPIEKYAATINHLPIEELDRCVFLCKKYFDVAKFQEASKLFIGLHDFRTFMGRSDDKQRINKISRRNIKQLDLIQVRNPVYTSYSWPNCVNDQYHDFTHYNVIIKSSGFLYKQVRRTLGALIAAAEDRVTCRDIRLMLEVPSKHSWHQSLHSAPARGLYLSEVEYPQEVYKTFIE